MDLTKEIIEIMDGFKRDGIRTTGKLENVLRFQDIVGRSTKEEIFDMWKIFDASQKSMFIWSISACLSYDVIVLVMEWTVGRDAKIRVNKEFRSEYDRLDARDTEIRDKTQELIKREKELETKIAAFSQIQTILNGILN